MAIISFKVRLSTGETIEVKDVESESTIGEVKKLLYDRQLSGVEADRQRLIFKGRILQDEQTLIGAGVQDGNTIHLVRSSTAKPSSTASPSSAPSNAARPTSAPGSTAAPPSSFFGGNAAADPFAAAFGGGGGFPGMPPGFGGAPNAEMLRQMMENPMIQRMLENPETIRALIQANPMMRAMIEQNPQLEHVLSDPQMMRQAMQAAANPAVMQEMLRSQDRALANIESLPGGHNALRRMFEQDIDPMVRAAEETTERMFEQQRNTNQQQQQQTQTSANTGPAASPMPNPWSAPAPQQPAQPQAGGAAFANPWAAFAGAGAGAGTAGGAFNPAANPLANMTTMMQDPDYMRRLMEPANMQAMMQLQQAIQQLQRGGIIPEGAFPSFPGAGGFPGGAFPGLGAFPGFPSAPAASSTPAPAAPQQPPEVRFAAELSQLESMGFGDRDRNIRALISTNGNVNAAIERLLQ